MTADNTKRILRLHTQLAKVMADGRFSDGRRKGADLRAFIIAYHWARFEGGDRDSMWERTKELAGLTGWRGDRGHLLRSLYEADLPRFEPVVEPPWAHPTCPVPMVRGPRAGEPCGKAGGSLGFRRTDPDTGEWAMVGYCTRHRDIGDSDRRNQMQLLRARTIPVPMPNTGGLLPCYIRATNWPDIYHDASHGRWKPPPVGITADDWPVLVKVHDKAREARRGLTVVPGGQETTDDSPPPALRLVID